MADARNEQGRKSMVEIEGMLQKMKLDNDWSMAQLKAEVHERGICLRNGKEYGKALRFVLAKHPVLIVGKRAAKHYPLAKKCLVQVPEA